MLCPFRIGRKPYDGGANCDYACAWFINGECAVSILAAELSQVKKVNHEKDDDRR